MSEFPDLSTPETLVNREATSKLESIIETIERLESNDYWQPVDFVGITSNPPTQAELDSILGTPESYNVDMVALVRDTSNSREWLVFGDASNSTWHYVSLNASAGVVGEAPNDGWMYARRSLAWTSTGGFSGDIGIGVTPATSRLHVKHTSSNVLKMERSANIMGFELTGTASGGIGLYDYVAAGYDWFSKGGNFILGGIATGSARLHIQSGNAFVDGVVRTRQSGTVTFRADRFVSSGRCTINAFNDSLAQYIPIDVDAEEFIVSTGTSVSEALRVASNRRVSIKSTLTPAQLYVNQSVSSGLPIPVLQLQQTDLSEEFINFEATVGAGNPTDTAAIGTYYGKIRVAVNGVFKYIALYNS